MAAGHATIGGSCGLRARVKNRDIAPFWEFDYQRVRAPFAIVVTLQAGAQFACLHTNNRVDPGVESLPPPEQLRT